MIKRILSNRMSFSASTANLGQPDNDVSSRSTVTEHSLPFRPGFPEGMTAAPERNLMVQDESSVGKVEERTPALAIPQHRGVDNQPQVMAASSGSLTKSSMTSLRSSVQSGFSLRRNHNRSVSSGEESRSTPFSSINFPITNELMRNQTNETEANIPIPIMRFETRRARFVQLGVMMLCLVLSLIITLTIGRGQLGISAASYMYNNAIVQTSVHKNAVSSYPKLSMPVLAAVIPSEIEQNMADVDEPSDIEEVRGNIVYWYIPKSGAKPLGILLFHCLGLVEASNIGSDHLEKELKILEDDELKIHYVNVDTTTREGIIHAQSLGLGLSGIADVIGTPLLSDIVNIFDASHRGRFFTIMRHPVDRASALFEDEKLMNPDLERMTIIDFVQSTKYQGNFLTRSLANKLSGELIDADFVLAKSMLHTKFIVGLYDRLGESFERFENYFGWSKLLMTDSTECMDVKTIPSEISTWDHHPASFLLPIVRENEYDIQLYTFAEQLFDLQANLTPYNT